ncbi:hypothetical protein L3V82_09440 [Thiotrichales bacterium 19S3-7]|nr:hypothetical protein [Thiotrichales bacterium 19S3-7]MCF6802353.1 hypothetical protein [Thiotrichales bacterium 19S3-11]
MYTLGFLSVFLGGLLNGSFIIPARFIKHKNNEIIWLYHTIIGLVCIPWLLLLLIYPDSIYLYHSLTIYDLSFLGISGVIFGIGQICFFYAIDQIGIALSFAINLGIGLVLGSIFVIGYQSMLLSYQGNLISIAIILILLSLSISYKLNQLHHSNLNKPTTNQKKQFGWILATLAGFASGLQNISFIVVANHSQSFSHTSNSYWYWPLFLSIAAIPMFFGFLKRYQRKNITTNAKNTTQSYLSNSISLILILMMGLCFSGSLVLYSFGMNLFTNTETISGWPILMITIILTSQIWGLIFGELKKLTLLYQLYRFISIFMLILAILLIGISH